MCFRKPNTREGPEKYIPIFRGRDHILINLRPTTCFLVNPKATFISTQLQINVWRPQVYHLIPLAFILDPNIKRREGAAPIERIVRQGELLLATVFARSPVGKAQRDPPDPKGPAKVFFCLKLPRYNFKTKKS